jgi:DNA-binding transcriptional ArsR family regulator
MPEHSPRRIRTLQAVVDGRVARVDYEYHIVVRRGLHDVPERNVSQSVYAMEDAGLIILNRDGTIQPTDRGRRLVERVREREARDDEC